MKVSTKDKIIESAVMLLTKKDFLARLSVKLQSQLM